MRDSEDAQRRLLDVARVFDRMPVGFCVVDIDLRYVYVNDALAAYNDVPKEAYIGRTASEVLPHSAARIEQQMRQVMATTTSVIGDMVQYDSKLRPGTIIYAKTTYSTVCDQNGRVIGATALVTDITEQEFAESSGQEIARRADQVLNALPVSVSYLDQEKRVLFANNTYKNTIGYTDEQITGQKLQDIIGDMAFFGAEPHVDLALQGEASEFENAITLKSGEKRGFISSYVPDFDDAGDVKGVIAAIVDVTDQLRTQTALEESEERLNLSLDAGAIGTWTWNLLDGSHFWDGRMLAISGMPPSALSGVMEDDFVKSLHPDDIAMVEEAIRQSLEDDVEYNITYRILRRDNGSVRDINAQATVVRDDTGQAIRMTGVAIDVTKQKQSAAELQAAYASLEERVAERTEALAKSNQRMKIEIEERMRVEAEMVERDAFVNTVISNMVDALITIDEKGLISSFNQAAENIFGYSPAEVDGQNIKMLMPDPDQAQHDGYLSVHVETGRSGILGKGPREVMGRHKDGSSLFLELSISEVVFGGQTMFIGALRDISARKRLEALFDRIAENSPNSILLKDLDGRIVLVNSRFEAWTGLSATDVVGKTSREIYRAVYAERVIASDQRVIRTGKVETEEWSADFADGTPHYLLATKFPVTDANNDIIGVGTISVDITELRAAELQLRQAQKMEAIGQLTGGIAHDFNNLLAIMLGNLSLLGEDLGPDHASADLLAPTMRAIDQATALTARMLAFSRQQPLDVQKVDVNELLHNIQSLIKRSLVEDIEIEFKLAAELSCCNVDPGQLEQAILNLSINARDAMPRGGHLSFKTADVTVAADDDWSDDITPGKYVVITVSDDGQGISQADMERIFDPFFTTKDVGKGTGLGLSMVYGFVTQSDGRVLVNSKEGVGTTFNLYLPAAISELEPEIISNVDADLVIDPAAAKGETILVVEDDRDVQAMVSLVLKKLGYQILLADDGRHGLTQLSAHSNIDLLLTDVLLPGGMNGQELADAARDKHQALKVLFMSGYPRDAIVDQGRLKSGVQLLSKPFDPPDLAQRVREVLDS